MKGWIALFVLGFVFPVSADGLRFPSNAKLTGEFEATLDSYKVPSGPWGDTGLPTLIGEGAVSQQAWQIAGSGLTTLQIMRPLRDQLRNDGYRVVFECEDVVCGGFDFRFAMDILSPPAMYVNLGDFRYLAAQRGSGANQELIALLTSRTAQRAYIHISMVGHETQIASATAPVVAGTLTPDNLEDQLDQIGRATLGDLAFATGSSQLADGPFESLNNLADYLRRFPERQVALVGHTDASGGLDANIQLSKRRAGSVLERLVSSYQIPRRQLDAQGNGYLSPIANNMTEEGRDANRRVEVILTSTTSN